MTLKAIEVTDTHTTCDCCGKNGLKKTVVMSDGNDHWFYGTSCAAAAAGVKVTSKSSNPVAAINDGFERQKRLQEAKNVAQWDADETGEPHVVIKHNGTFKVLRAAAHAAKAVSAPTRYTAFPN